MKPNPNTPDAAPDSAGRSAIETRLAAAGNGLHGRRRRLVMAILQDAAETCFLSSPEVARRYGVDAATVVRTVQALGYERYADFAADLRSHLLARLSPYTIFQDELQEARSLADRIRHSIHSDQAKLQLLAAGLDVQEVILAARRIQEARRIFIVAADTASALTFYLCYVLRSLGFDAEHPQPTEGYLQYTTRLMKQEDLLIAISFGRCLRLTVETAVAARKLRVPTLCLTDSPNTPLARACEQHLVAPIAGPIFFGSFVAPLAVINALVVACAYQNPDESLRKFLEVEEHYRSPSRWYEPSLGESPRK